MRRRACAAAAVLAAAALLNLALWVGPASAQDVRGGADAPLITRYQGSRLVAWKDDGYASVELPTAYDRDGGRWKQSVTVEGERQFRVYRAPTGRTGLEVQRNYELALTAAGGTRVLGCSGERCNRDANEIKSSYASWLSQPSWSQQREDVAFHIVNSGQTIHHAIFKITRAGQTSYVTVLTSDGATEGTGTVVDILTLKSMEAGKVAISTAQAIAQGLKAEGRMAVYGIGFDTGRADIRPESQLQLNEMAMLLKGQPALKVYIVGHTDNAGSLEANLVLSQRRAEAIVQALTRDYAIPAQRMLARGVANLAPVASNAGEEGRARNRRVELVVQ